MAKIRLINTYTKMTVVRDSNGLPVLDAMGNETKKPTTMFRYGIVGATPEELAQYKLSRNSDGENYYREEAGVPLFYSSRFVGKEATINGYQRDDKQWAFSVDSTDLDVIKALQKEAPEMATALAGQIVSILSAGERLKLKAETHMEETPGAGDDGAAGDAGTEPGAGEEVHASGSGDGLED